MTKTPPKKTEKPQSQICLSEVLKERSEKTCGGECENCTCDADENLLVLADKQREALELMQHLVTLVSDDKPLVDAVVAARARTVVHYIILSMYDGLPYNLDDYEVAVGSFIDTLKYLAEESDDKVVRYIATYGKWDVIVDDEEAVSVDYKGVSEKAPKDI
jgi:hypothetical protein